MGSANDTEAESCAADEHNLANAVRVPSTLYQRVHQPATDSQVRRRRDKPWHPGVKERVQQIDMQGERKVAWQPGQQEIKDVVIRAEAQRSSKHLPLS